MNGSIRDGASRVDNVRDYHAGKQAIRSLGDHL